MFKISQLFCKISEEKMVYTEKILVNWYMNIPLITRWALSFYLVFEDEKSNALDEKSVKRKIA